MTTMIRNIILTCLIAVALTTADLRGEQTLQISLPAVADTTLNQTSPDNNMGGITTVFAGITNQTSPQSRRGLFQFDIAGNLPAGAVINSAALTLTAVQQSGTPAESDYDLFRARVGWTEGTGSVSPSSGAVAFPGESSWNYRFASTTAWGAAGGLAGVDFESTASASAHIVDITTLTTYTWTGAGLTNDVQTWLDNPASNHGWFLLSGSDTVKGTARGFASRENLTTGAAPALFITYTAPVPEPSTLILLAACLLGVAWPAYAARRSRRTNKP